MTGVWPLTYMPTDVGGELWSPDGKNILFTSDVYPECDGAPKEELLCNENKVREARDSKIKAQIFDRLLYRHWNAYKEGRRSHIFANPVLFDSLPPTTAFPFDQTLPRDLTPGDYDAPVFSLGGQDNYAFSPDGQEVCYTSNHDKVEATSTNNDLWVVPVNGGPAKNITADNPASDSTPLYSPDGKYIAYRVQQRPGYESDRFRLMLYDRRQGTSGNATEEFDRWIGTFAWAPDSTQLYFAAEDHGESPLYTLWFQGNQKGEVQSRVSELMRGFNDDLTLTLNGKTLMFTRMSLGAPIEIYKGNFSQVDPASDACKKTFPYQGLTVMYIECPFKLSSERVTHLNDAVLSQVAMSPLETFWFPGTNGDKVQGFLVKPPNFDASKKYPVKFLIHGGPQGAWGDDWSYRWNPELFAANGYVVIMINFHGSTGYGQKFIDAINGDWGGTPFEDLMKGLDYAEHEYFFIDRFRECALGASYGGYMANWVLGHTDRFKCIVSHDGMFNTFSAWGTTEELWFNNWEFGGTPYTNHDVYNKWSPRNSSKNFKTPTLVIHGQLDYRLDVSEGFQLFTTLQTMGVPSKMLYFPDEGHWVLKPQNSQLWYKTVNDWVDQWIGTKK